MRKIAFALSALAIAGAASAAEIRALGGTFEEDVQEIKDEGGKGLVLRTATRAVPLDSIKSIRFQEAGTPPAEKQAVKVLLTTGDLLRGTIGGGPKADEVVLVTKGLGELRVPFGLLRGVLFEVASERERDLLARAAAYKEQIEEVFLREGGSLRGSLTKIDPLGVSIETEVDGGSKIGLQAYELSKVELVMMGLLEEPPAPAPGLRVQLRLTDGSLLAGALEGLQGETVKLKHPLAPGAPPGQGPSKTLSIPVSRVAELSVQNGAFVYLSDLDPTGVDQRFPPEFSYSVDAYGWKRDRVVTGRGPLRLGGRTYDKGLGVHSYCALTYQLGGEFRELRAMIGLDDSTRNMGEPGFGAVVFRVLVDGKPAKEYPAGLVARKGENPQEVKVDVTGAKTITLVADFDPTSLHVLGRADWADAHLIRTK